MRKIYFLLSVLCLSTLFASCKDDKEEGLEISPKEMNLVVGETKTIKVNGGVSGCKFISANENIASVEGNGVVTAVLAGETEITVTDKNNVSAKCKIKVAAKSKMYTEPYLQFGASMSQVKSFEKRTIISDDGKYLFYNGENKYVDAVAYTFENKKLTASAVFVPVSNLNTDLLVAFLGERYILSVDYDSDIYFISPDEKIIGSVTVANISSGLQFLILYLPSNRTNKSIDIDYKFIKERVKEIKNSMKFKNIII